MPIGNDMKLSVAHTFDRDLVPRLAAVKEVCEVYGKLDRDIVGGGRSTYTLRRIGRAHVRRAVEQAHAHGIAFNYLINGASLGGAEQTRAGQRRIRKLLDWVSDIGADAVTITSPFLARIVRRCYPHLHIRTSAFAMVDTAGKARQWEDIGAETICVSAITCNRDFERLACIREAVSCQLQLIANASCLIHCAWEPTHMQVLTQSSRSGDATHGFCLDYCVLNCSHMRLKAPQNYVRAVWIRPEDLSAYEKIGYTYFKVLERSCPTDLLVKRTEAYARRSFDGNLYELVAPIASIKRELGVAAFGRMRMAFSMARPNKIPLRSLLRIEKYMKVVIPHEFGRENALVYIDNRALDGFLREAARSRCGSEDCARCGVCERYTRAAVTVREDRRDSALARAESLWSDAENGSLW